MSPRPTGRPRRVAGPRPGPRTVGVADPLVTSGVVTGPTRRLAEPPRSVPSLDLEAPAETAEGLRELLATADLDPDARAETERALAAFEAEAGYRPTYLPLPSEERLGDELWVLRRREGYSPHRLASYVLATYGTRVSNGLARRLADDAEVRVLDESEVDPGFDRRQVAYNQRSSISRLTQQALAAHEAFERADAAGDPEALEQALSMSGRAEERLRRATAEYSVFQGHQLQVERQEVRVTSARDQAEADVVRAMADSLLALTAPPESLAVEAAPIVDAEVVTEP